jgi:hypothetical protein
MGPFSTAILPAQENITSAMRCTLAGFEGEFFDSNDVEGYLRGHGFDIPPAADFITGQIDLAVISGATSPRTDSTDSGFPLTPRSPIGKILDETSQDVYNFNYINGNSSEEVQTDGTTPSFMTFSSWNTKTSKESNPFDITGPVFDATTGPNSGRSSPFINANNKRHTEKRTVTISVETLINGMLFTRYHLDHS